LFVGFLGTVNESDFSPPFIDGFGARLPVADQTALRPVVGREISRLPPRRFPYMPRSLTPQVGLSLTISVQDRVAFCGP